MGKRWLNIGETFLLYRFPLPLSPRIPIISAFQPISNILPFFFFVEVEGNEGKNGEREEGLDVFFRFWGNIVTSVRVIDTISSDVEAEGWRLAHFSCHVFWDVADMVAVMGEYLNGVWIIGVCWFSSRTPTPRYSSMLSIFLLSSQNGCSPFLLCLLDTLKTLNGFVK